MPIDAAASRDGLRLGLCTGLLFALGLMINWKIFYLAPIFASLALRMSQASGSFRAGLWIFTQAALLCGGATVLFLLLMPYPAATLFAICAAVVLSLVWALRAAEILLVVFALLAALMVPHMLRISPDTATTLVPWLVINLGFAVVAARLMTVLLPPLPRDGTLAEGAWALPEFDRGRRVARMSLVPLPLIVVFFVWQTGALLTVVFVAVLTSQLIGATMAAPIVARNMFWATVGGGIAAVIAYELTVVAPMPITAALAGLAICLIFARAVTRGSPTASSGLSAAVILFGSAVGAASDDAATRMVLRRWQVGEALVYLLIGFVVIDRLLPERALPVATYDPSRATAA